ncbi:MAG TPA: [FeFe] hydrogenase, group A [Candidatus Moranbacteria bacterium]|nr:[FeFe] hydrogenase, group A [Candidatus Moranbacteria bacterium]
MNSFKIYINNKEVVANEGERILDIARRENIHIPSLCHHSDLEPHESCRLCMVEVEGDKILRASCALLAKPEMKIHTDTPATRKALKINLELLFSQHEGSCEHCSRVEKCKLQEYSEKHAASGKYHINRKLKLSKFQFGPSIFLDQSKCINCQNCSDMCAKQTKGGFIILKQHGETFEMFPSEEKDRDCIYCGQCIMHCPVNALSEIESYKKVKKLLQDYKKKVVFQFAPSVRTSFGEEFGMPLGTNVTDRIFTALKKVGAYRVFDTSFAADVTIIEEAKELLEKIEKGDNTTMISSCCPAWVKYAEFYEPELLKNLTTVRSPQIILGGLIKTYWAEKENLNPKDIVSVSIMPCTAKKFEIEREELFINGKKTIDYVLTVREMAKLLKEFDVHLDKIEPDESDKEILANPSGAGEIFGAGGGVLEAALRTVYQKLTGQELQNLEFKPLHEFKRTKMAKVTIGGKTMKVVAVSGMENAKKILEEVKTDPTKYAYVEVMACPGGCIGGGGQPIPIDDEIRKARAAGLYSTDEKRKVRTSHGNPGIDIIYKEFLNDEKNCHKVCHTTYEKRKKGKVKKI